MEFGFLYLLNINSFVFVVDLFLKIDLFFEILFSVNLLVYNVCLFVISFDIEFYLFFVFKIYDRVYLFIMFFKSYCVLENVCMFMLFGLFKSI